MAKFQPGNPGKLPGTKNKKPRRGAEMRELISTLSKQTFPKLSEKLIQLAEDDPKAFIDAWLKMQEFVLPKLQRTEVLQDSRSFNITIVEHRNSPNHGKETKKAETAKVLEVTPEPPKQKPGGLQHL